MIKSIKYHEDICSVFANNVHVLFYDLISYTYLVFLSLRTLL